VHAVDQGGKVVVRAAADGDASVLIEVADSGPGVPEADREKISSRSSRPNRMQAPASVFDRPQHRRFASRSDSVTRSDLGGAAFRVVIPIV